LFHNRIEGVALWALDSQKVPVAPMTFCLTIIAHDVYYTLQITGHGMLRNVSRSGFPRGCHRLLGHDRLFTNRAAVIKPGQLSKAVSMNRMTTRQVLRRLPGGEHVFPTYRAVVLVFVLETLVSVKHTDGNAHATFITVPKGIRPAHSAESAFDAMEWLFGLQ
jgi:hypothetical protein